METPKKQAQAQAQQQQQHHHQQQQQQQVEVDESHYRLPTSQASGGFNKFTNNFNIKPKGWGSGKLKCFFSFYFLISLQVTLNSPILLKIIRIKKKTLCVQQEVKILKTLLIFFFIKKVIKHLNQSSSL